MSDKDLLAFKEACRINGLPEPDFNSRRTEDITICNEAGIAIGRITPEGKIFFEADYENTLNELYNLAISLYEAGISYEEMKATLIEAVKAVETKDQNQSELKRGK